MDFQLYHPLHYMEYLLDFRFFKAGSLRPSESRVKHQFQHWKQTPLPKHKLGD